MLNRRDLTRTCAGVTALGLGLASSLRTLAQNALENLPEGSLREQIIWFTDHLNEPDVALTEPEVDEHFADAFLAQVPAAQMVEITGQVKGMLRGVTIADARPGASEFDAVVLLIGGTGLQVRLSIAVDPVSGLITGLLLQPVEDVSATDDEATPVAASPVAAASPPTTEEILAGYQAAAGELMNAGRELTEALLAGDDEAVISMFSESLVALLDDFSASEVMEQLTTNIVSFSIAEVDAHFAAPYTPEEIVGFYHQQALATFRLTPDEPQSGMYPTGHWTGEIMIGALTLGIEVTFSGTADDLAAMMSIPEQLLQDHPLSDVRFERERPLGALVDERALPMGPSMGTSSYGALYEWGDALVAINSAFDAENRAIAISRVMQMSLPDDPAAGTTISTTFRVPFEGAYLVIWGGDSEFRNYHAPAPQQRYAHDIAIWRDGATYTGDGTHNEDYHCYGQPQYAPAAGTIATVVDGYPDDMPGPESITDASTHPAGNHVVIEVSSGEYILMAHFRPGSVAVAEGDSIAAGDLVGMTGNSGNSSEPHIHIHMQTGPDIFDPATVGLPMEFEDILVNGEPVERAPIEQGQIVEPA